MCCVTINIGARSLAVSGRLYSLLPPQVAKEQFDGLTSREGEAAALVAQGNSNREIADTLVASERTAAAHASNFLSKQATFTGF